MVLGMDWLGSLGPLQIDFSTPHLYFTHYGSQITFHDTNKLLHNHITLTHIYHLLHANVISSLHLLTFQQTLILTPSFANYPYVATLN